MMLKFLLIGNKQGQTRFSSHFDRKELNERCAYESDVIRKCLSRGENQCSFLDYQDVRLVYKSFSSLHVIVGVDKSENEIAMLEFIQLFMETLDNYFEKVTELHIMFNLDKVHMILREMVVNGVIAETSKVRILSPIRVMDKLDCK